MIAAAIEALPKAQRTVIALRDIEGWSAEEVCAALEIADGNQRILLHRARSRVRTAIEDYLGAVEPFDIDAVTRASCATLQGRTPARDRPDRTPSRGPRLPRGGRADHGLPRGRAAAASGPRCSRSISPSAPAARDYVEQMRTLAGGLGALREEALPRRAAQRADRLVPRVARPGVTPAAAPSLEGMAPSAATPNDTVPARATRREWIGLAVIALPCLLYAMDLTVLTLAVPALTADLRPSANELLWIVDIYGFLVAGLLVTMGTLGDRIGRRRLLLIGAAAFGAASVLAAFAPTAETLIAARALLGVAGATLAPSTLSLIRSMFLDAQQRTVAIGVWVTSFSAGAAIGPLVGGVLLEQFWWGSVFLLAVPPMIVLLAVGPRLLPEYRDPEPGPLDLVSVALSLAAVLLVIYGVKTVASDGAGWAGIAPALAGLLAAAVFVDRQRRVAHPMLDLGLFRTPGFSPVARREPAGLRRPLRDRGLRRAVPAARARPVAARRRAVEHAGGARVHRRIAAHAACRGAAGGPRR